MLINVTTPNKSCETLPLYKLQLFLTSEIGYPKGQNTIRNNCKDVNTEMYCREILTGGTSYSWEFDLRQFRNRIRKSV